MPGIDDPLDAVRKQYPEHATPASLLIDVGAQLHPFAGMVNAVRAFFSKREAEARVKALLQAIEWYVRENERQIEELSDRVNSSEFIETLLGTVDRTLRTANTHKIRRFAQVLGHELISESDVCSYEDAAAYIKTLSELGEMDIKVLSVLHAFQSYLLTDAGRSHKADAGRLFWGIMQGVYGEISERGITFEEYYSRCSKLNGYGLLHRVNSGPGFSWSSNDMPYEIECDAHFITKSGKKLIDILGNDTGLLATADEHRKQVLIDIERLKAGTINSFPQPYRSNRKGFASEEK